LKPVAGELRGICPIHQGSDPNFAVNPESGFWHCHSQCKEGGDVFDFLSRKEGLDFPSALAAIAEWTGSPARLPPHGTKPQNEAPRRIVQSYGYTDEVGTLLFQAVRYDPKGFNQRRPTPNGTWLYSLGDVRRVLYRLPDVLAAVAAGRPVYVCEGEKDADALATLGLCATTAPMGAGKWEPAYTEALCGAGVVLLPDNDTPGLNHARLVADALHGTAKRIRIVELPGLPDKGDVCDWLAAGNSKPALLELVKAAPDWTPEPLSFTPSSAGASAAVDPNLKQAATTRAEVKPPKRKPIAERIVDLADVAPPTELPLLFGQYLLKGHAHWLTGQTGLGKSTLLFNIACALAEGTPLWGIDCQQTRVLYCDMESGDMGRAHKIERLYREAPRVRGHLLFLREPVKLPDELPELLAFASERGVSLVIFDTARRCFSVKDENDNAEVYNRVVPTLDALKAAGVATLTLGHPSKNGNGSARGAGAQEDAGDVNLNLTMHRGEVGDKDGVIALRVSKNRLLGLGIPTLYLKRIGDDQFERLDTSEATPQEEPVSKQIQCRQALMDILADTEIGMTHGAMLEAAQRTGFAKATFARTLKAMKDAEEVRLTPDGSYLLADPFAGE